MPASMRFRLFTYHQSSRLAVSFNKKSRSFGKNKITGTSACIHLNKINEVREKVVLLQLTNKEKRYQEGLKLEGGGVK